MDWLIFITLLFASILATIGGIPYILTIQGVPSGKLEPPLLKLIIKQMLILIPLLMLAIAIGLYLANDIGLGIPMLKALFTIGKVEYTFSDTLKISIITGVSAGVIIMLLDKALKLAGVDIKAILEPNIWQSFLATFYGAIFEEIVMRLFLMTLLIKGLLLLSLPMETSTWIAIIVVAILFGLLHLPVTKALTALTPMVVIRAVLLNGLAGLLFGWLYWTHGLEAAIISHFFVDFVLLVVPKVVKRILTRT